VFAARPRRGGQQHQRPLSVDSKADTGANVRHVARHDSDRALYAMLPAVAAGSRDALSTPVYIESGAKRVFACALDWPGWCRSGKDEEQALDALSAAGPRYAAVAARASLPFPATGRDAFDVVERLPGSANTDFGVPYEIASRDATPLTEQEARRLASLVSASWKVLDMVVAAAPAELRKGPRGGGRDRDAIAAHVIGAESIYARKLGIRLPAPAPGDLAGLAALREAILEVLGSPSAGAPVVQKGWHQRYAARRIAWHALDHAWEIEDRTEPR